MNQSVKGIGLLELCMVLAVIAVLMLMVLREYHVVQSANDQQRFKQQWVVLIDACQQWREAHGDFQSLNLSGLRAECLLPKSWRMNRWGGEVHLGPSRPSAGTARQHLTLALTQVPRSTCLAWQQMQLPWLVSSECSQSASPDTDHDASTATWHAIFRTTE